MTVINVTAALTALGGSEPVTSGRITVEYLRGKDGEPATRAAGATVTLPAAIIIAIVDGAPVAPVDVPPTDGTCYARVTVTAMKPYSPMPLELPAVAIPSVGPVDITALVAVDPASYEPVTSAVTAWQLAVGQVATMQSDVTAKTAQAIEAAADAGTYAEATEFDANRAGSSAFQAGQSAASALGHRNAAAESAAAAEAAAGTSLGAAAKNPDLIIVGTITRDANQAVTSADVVWPDGTPGTFTALTLSAAFPGAVDSYKITYGSPVTKTFTQPAITRNSAGAATTVPQIVVS